MQAGHPRVIDWFNGVAIKLSGDPRFLSHGHVRSPGAGDADKCFAWFGDRSLQVENPGHIVIRRIRKLLQKRRCLFL